MRSLADAELEHNRLVDEARFKGNPPESNVAIAAGVFDTTVEKPGDYKVDGTYTFTYNAVTDGKVRLTWRWGNDGMVIRIR